MTAFFFGSNRRKKLTIEKFLDFQQQLQSEILNLEFRRKEPNAEGKITEAEFAELLLAYAGYPSKKKARMLKRVKKKCVASIESNPFILTILISIDSVLFSEQVQGC